MRRVVQAEGGSRCWVNGHPVPLSMLANLAKGLAELSSQHEHHALADPSTHLFSLDAFARLDGERREVARGPWRGPPRPSASCRGSGVSGPSGRAGWSCSAISSESSRRSRHRQGEEREHEQGLGVLRAASHLLDVARSGEANLYSRDGAASELVAAVGQRLRDAATVDERLGAVKAQLDEVQALLEDAADELRKYGESARGRPGPARPGRGEARGVRPRAPHARRPGRQSRGDPSPADRGQSLKDLESHEELAGEAQAALDRALEDAAGRAQSLSGRRKAAARKPRLAFARALKDLGHGKAKVEVQVLGGTATSTRVSPATTVEGVTLIAEPGEPARPPQNASGTRALARCPRAQACARRRRAGRHLRLRRDRRWHQRRGRGHGRAEAPEDSRHHQVLCVTHLPQVAALADEHFLVRKRRQAGRTVTEVLRLDRAGRIEELARMLSGSKVTDRARAAAEELLAAGTAS